MNKTIQRRCPHTPHPFDLIMNPQASRDSAWSAVQDDILNDRALAAARTTISSWPGYSPTAMVELGGFAHEIGLASLHYKDESTRFGLGSFKALGGAYAVARLLQLQVETALGHTVPMAEIIERTHPDIVSGITVCCATDGNHGRSVAWGARNFGCHCVIFIHATVSEGRRDAIAQYGAEVRRSAGNYDDSVREAQQTASREGWFVVSDTSYEGYMEIPKDVMQGYEVMAAEAFEQLDTPPTHIFLQTGVGGMAAAVAAQAKRRWGADRPWIVLADPDRAACWLESIGAGAPRAVSGDLDTLMAGLACGEVSALAWTILRDHADAAMAVPDEAATALMRRLAEPSAGDRPMIAGESAVAGLAGLVAAFADSEACTALHLGTDSRVLVFGTEGDTDAALYREIVGADAATVLARAA